MVMFSAAKAAPMGPGERQDNRRRRPTLKNRLKGRVEWRDRKVKERKTKQWIETQREEGRRKKGNEEGERMGKEWTKSGGGTVCV